MAAVFFAALLPGVAFGQFAREEAKLVGTGSFLTPDQGQATALSANGDTAIVGGPLDSGGDGAAWVFVRSGGVWAQQGTKLVGALGFGAQLQGYGVALSADGNTALVGGPLDNLDLGAAWVYARSAAGWTQQGPKLTGTDANVPSQQGYSVALSADGNTAIVGAPAEAGVGAAWIFVRTGSTWTQQGPKLIGAGSEGPSAQGSSVAMSADGNSAIVGGPDDDAGRGAAWVFTRSDNVWSQQGTKLVGTGAIHRANQGHSVSLSANGGTAIVGGPSDDSLAGAAWIFVRNGGVWAQQGSKLVGTGATTDASQGSSVSISGDGNLAIVGGPFDNSGSGATWIFSRNGDTWAQRGGKVAATATGNVGQGASVALSADATTILVGGPGETETGAAWIFAVAPFGNAGTSLAVPTMDLKRTFALSGALALAGLVLLRRRAAN